MGLQYMSLFQVRIYYEDTDAGGLVYHANYLKYFERARSEWLRDIGITQAGLLEQGLGFVVGEITIKYRRPAFFEQLLTVETNMIDQRRVSLLFHQSITNEQGELVASGDVTVAAVNLDSKRATAIPAQLREVFESAR
jgi:acyl-CoA thioester hydrolase